MRGAPGTGRSGIALAAAALVLLAGARAAGVPASGPLDVGHLFFAGDLGVGQLRRSGGGFDDDQARFYMAGSGGFAVSSRVLLGLEIGGWLVEAGDIDDPGRGAGVAKLFVTGRVYPFRMSGFHVRAGAGAVNAWENAPDGIDAWGAGWEAGIGYDVSLTYSQHITPFLVYSRGSAGAVRVRAVTLGVGYTWR